MEWQPIETAPKDGTPILLFYRRLGVGHIDVGSWYAYSPSSGVWLGGESEIAPTRWMPLPPTPEEEIEAFLSKNSEAIKGNPLTRPTLPNSNPKEAGGQPNKRACGDL